MSDVFGQIVPGHVVEDAVVTLLREWFGTYLAEVAYQWERPVVPSPLSYNVRPEGEKWTEDLLPACVVVSPGTTGAPRASGDGYYEADYVVGILIFCSGTDEDSVRKNASDYAASARAIVLQKRGLGGLCTGVIWTGESYTPGPSDGRRSIGAAIVEFTMTIVGTVSRSAGPSQPNVAPGTQWGTVETTDLDVDRLS